MKSQTKRPSDSMPDAHYLTLRLSHSLYLSLANEAYAQQRPISAQVRYILTERYGPNTLILPRVADYLKQHKTATRLQLLRQGHFSALDLNYALSQLLSDGHLSIVLDGAATNQITTSTEEKYSWKD